MRNTAEVFVRTSFKSVVLIVKYNENVIFRGVSEMPDVKINGKYVYENYRLLQMCKNDGYCRNLLALIDSFCLTLKNYNISSVKLDETGPKSYFFHNILSSLGIRINSIFNATTIPHNGCRMVRRRQL